MKLPKSFYSWPTALGAAIAGISLISIIFLVLLSFLTDTGSTYSGLITYIVLPAILVIGLLLIPIGIISQSIRGRKPKPDTTPRFPVLDINQPVQRRIFFLFGTITVILILGTAYGSYEAFHYTESIEFCGQVCHQIMEPEYTAYRRSPHSRIACVECHVGTGASWYVKSKMSGLRQVVATLKDSYPRPIPTPVHNLRPARETCEQCHWPEKFYDRKLVVNKHYLPDESNTEWDITLLMKTGPMHSGQGYSEGIHWHINPDVQIEYYATDKIREQIPWVRYINKVTGDTTVYIDGDSGFESLPDSAEVRVMDCLDCHNRPTHNFKSPMVFVNEAFAAGELPVTLPDLKSLAMQVLNTEYPTTDSAMQAIDAQVNDYYQSMYEDIWTNRKPEIEQAITSLQENYKKYIFPIMNVTWDKFPNHIGHLEFNGCFRCHNDRHADRAGHVISRDCSICHSIVAQGAPDTLKSVPVFQEMEFAHPNDPDAMWKEMNCTDCHRELYSM